MKRAQIPAIVFAAILYPALGQFLYLANSAVWWRWCLWSSDLSMFLRLCLCFCFFVSPFLISSHSSMSLVYTTLLSPSLLPSLTLPISLHPSSISVVSMPLSLHPSCLSGLSMPLSLHPSSLSILMRSCPPGPQLSFYPPG